MFGKILIANRGEIAVRVAQTAQRMGIRTVAIYSDADAQALHVRVAEEAFRVGPPAAKESYLSMDAIIAVAKRSGAEAIHPGYGFLSENPDFVDAVERANLVFIGPPAAAIRAMGLKDQARMLMQKAGVPVLPGYNGENQDTEHLAREAARIGFPILIKPVAGGGGKGMHRVDKPEAFTKSLESARREAAAAFGNDRVLIEKFLGKARHIEIQVFADSHGNTLHLFERDCSLQRRHQKVVEEAPAPGMTADLRAVMGKAAIAAARAVGYVGAGTVEFIVDVSKGLSPEAFFFMEMNTRLQVEHPVTEMITGLDLVEWQLRVANGEPLPKQQGDVAISGHAIEARLYAEDPLRNFLPQSGKLEHLQFAQRDGLRIDTGFSQGDAVATHYDPMIAKMIAHGPTRAVAQRKLAEALAETQVSGFRTNLAFLSRLVQESDFITGNIDTGFIERNIDKLARGSEPPIETIAAALLHAGGHLSVPASSSPFDTLINFRLWHGETQNIEFLVDGAPLKASLTDHGNMNFMIAHAGESTSFILLNFDNGCVRFVFASRIVRLAFFDDGTLLTINFDGVIHEFAIAESRAGHGSEEDNEGVVIAPMPGLVSIVNVKSGDHVTKGDVIAVTESMKMEFALRAPRTGKIAMVNVAAGEQVEEGAIIATIEDADA